MRCIRPQKFPNEYVKKGVGNACVLKEYKMIDENYIYHTNISIQFNFGRGLPKSYKVNELCMKKKEEVFTLTLMDN